MTQTAPVASAAPLTQYDLPNSDRTVRFLGVQIAHATSREGSDIRWTEVDIYRTAGGQYALHRIGMSRVFHDAANPGRVTNGKKLTAKQTVKLEASVYDDLFGDPVTLPNDPEPSSFAAGIVLEQPRYTVITAKDAVGLVEAAHNVDGEGVRFLTKVAERALRTASDVDDAVREAFMVETLS